ncbi:MAG: sensor histidine kinase [Salinarimonadaceae bacterium]|nr:MAG: sensor histidine kinase [Salinarimonadaceae bacterium]
MERGETGEQGGAAAGSEERPVRFGLSARLLWLTIGFVMLAEILIYAPSVANFQRSWLSDRLGVAQVAALVLDAAPDEALSRPLEDELLRGVGAMVVAVRGGGARRLLAVTDPPTEIGRTIDLRETGALTAIAEAFSTLLAPTGRPLRVIGGAMMEGARGGPGSAAPPAESGRIDFVEIVVPEEPLREALLRYSRNILILSLLISCITAGLVYLALHFVIVRPVRRLVHDIARFAQAPEDRARIITPSTRGDEIGVAERALARMERALEEELRRKRRLAELGLGVSKINHELRNILTTAQLLSDRMAGAADPLVRRFAPRLVATLQRAIDFSEATLGYGRAVEPEPARTRFLLAPLAGELADLPGIALAGDEEEADPEATRLHLAIPDDLEIDADREQLLRLLVNLARNAAQACAAEPPERRRIDLSAKRDGSVVEIHFADHGPGLPPRARAHLFEPFHGVGQPGGSGLGLAICAEIARLHGGAITLAEKPPGSTAGATFRVTIPDRP